MAAPTYSRAELCLIHMATALAAGGANGDSAELLRARAAVVLKRLPDPSPDLVWLISTLRAALHSPHAGAWWRLELAVADMSIRRAAALFDAEWEVVHDAAG